MVTCLCLLFCFVFFSQFLFPYLPAHKTRGVRYVLLHKITVLQSLLSTRTRTKLFVVHSLSPAAEDGEDDDLGVSDDSGYMKSREESSELPSGHSLPKSDGNI